MVLVGGISLSLAGCQAAPRGFLAIERTKDGAFHTRLFPCGSPYKVATVSNGPTEFMAQFDLPEGLAELDQELAEIASGNRGNKETLYGLLAWRGTVTSVGVTFKAADLAAVPSGQALVSPVVIPERGGGTDTVPVGELNDQLCKNIRSPAG